MSQAEDSGRDLKIALLEERLFEAVKRLEKAETSLSTVEDSITKGKFGFVVLVAIGGIASWAIGIWKDVFLRGH